MSGHRRLERLDREADVRSGGTTVKPRTKTAAATQPHAAVDADAADQDAEDRQRGGVQSIGRAFAILEEIARNREGVGLAELSRRVALHSSTTFHLVRTLVSLGYVRQLKDSKRYRIGRPLFALAAGALDEIEMTSLATPVLEDLSRATGESAHFAVRMGDSVMVLARTAGSGAFQLIDRAGVVRPAHCTALGKAILAGLPPDQVDRFLARAELKAYTPKSITDAGLLRREIAEARRTGIAFDNGEFDAEVRCVALSVSDFTGQVVGAIGMSGPVWRLSNHALHNHARAVRAAADRLSEEFGHKSERDTHVKVAG
ncbi:MAG: IclR family transcriptional regulator [Alphaproteobacteria bacterium]|nr:IclR family transcriptional regulator [Alphaproteobacteria bacterium]